ncbi:MAG: terminase small subunit [Cyanobacteria bacterium P01_A01_bin.17]
MPVISQRDLLFCHKYVESGKKSQSAREAGYEKSPGTVAQRLLRRPEINEYIDQLVEEREELRRITATGVIIELGKTAFFDFSEVVDALNGDRILDKNNWSREARSAISSIKVTRSFTGSEEQGDRLYNVTTEIKTWDRLRALKMLGDHVGAFTDLNVAIAVLKTYGIELAKIDGEWQVLRSDNSA